MEDEARGKGRRPRPSEFPPGCDALMQRSAVAVAIGDISIRTLNRMISAGEFPPAEANVGIHPVWRLSTVNAWIVGRCEEGRR